MINKFIKSSFYVNCLFVLSDRISKLSILIGGSLTLLFIYLFIYLFTYLFIYLLIYLFIYLSVCLFVYLFVYLFVHLFIDLSNYF